MKGCRSDLDHKNDFLKSVLSASVGKAKGLTGWRLLMLADVGAWQCQPRSLLHAENPDKWKCQLAHRCSTNLKPGGNLAYNCPLVFISDTLLSIFNEAAAGVTSGESALWEGEMKERRGGEGRKREASHRFLSLSLMNVAQVR